MQRAVLVLLLSCLFWFRPAPAMTAHDAISGTQVGKGAPLFKENLSIIKDAEFAYVRLKIGSQQKAQKDKISQVSRTIKAIKKAAARDKLIEVVVMDPGTEVETKSSSKFFSYLSSSQAASYEFSLSFSSSPIVQVDAPLGGSEDIYDASQRHVEFVDSLNLPRKAVVTFGDVSLAVQRPEEYAGKLKCDGCGLTKEVADKFAHRTDPNATVACFGSLVPELKMDISFKPFLGRGSGESLHMKFQGNGFVVIQSDEETYFQAT